MPTARTIIEHGQRIEDMEQLEIAEVFCNTGGRVGICRLPGRFGRFSADLDKVIRWAPCTVVTMTTQKEMEEANAADLGNKLKTVGIGWIHLPVADYGGIGEDNAQRWSGVSLELHKILNDGGRVLVHCRGGHGRSGMVALRLLVEQGERPEDAVLRIREARPGAIETDEQMAWGKQIFDRQSLCPEIKDLSSQ